MAGLPPSVSAIAERSPIEDVLLAVLADKLPDVKSGTLINNGQTFPYILVRRASLFGNDSGDPRFIDRAPVTINAFAEDPNGDFDAAVLSEAVRVILRDAARERKVYPGLGHVLAVEMPSPPRQAANWATATGAVQFADLPTSVWRYETQYTVAVRIPTTS